MQCRSVQCTVLHDVAVNFSNLLKRAVPIFKALALLADAFYKLKCPYICLSVSVSVCLSVCSLLRYRLTVFLPPLPEVGCPIFWEIQNPLGKVLEISVLKFEHFCLEVVLNCHATKSFFCCCWFCLTKHGGNHAFRWIRDLWSKGISLILACADTICIFFLRFHDFLRFSIFFGFRSHPTVDNGWVSRGRVCGCGYWR